MIALPAWAYYTALGIIVVMFVGNLLIRDYGQALMIAGSFGMGRFLRWLEGRS